MSQSTLLDAVTDLRRSIYAGNSDRFLKNAIKIIEKNEIKGKRIQKIKNLLKKHPNEEELLMAAVLLQNEVILIQKSQ